MKIFLINPPFYFQGDLEYLTQNLGLGYLAAYLLRRGHTFEALDALAEGADNFQLVNIRGRSAKRYGLSFDEITRRIPSGADMIGITAPFSNHATIIDELSIAIKKIRPNIPIVLGGVYPSTQPERALESSVDFVVVGEGEIPLAALADGVDPHDVPGVWHKKDGEIVNGGRSEMIAEPDSIPFPARHLFPMEKYFSISPRGLRASRSATMITSRGCPYSCSFCSIHPVYARQWRARSPENVLAEIDKLIDEYGIKSIEFEDDNLTLDAGRAKAIFEGLISRRIAWSCPNGVRVDSLDAQMIGLMKRSGCNLIHLAVESGDPEMLKIMNKKLSLDQALKVASTCHELGMGMIGFFIVGHPGETEARFRNTLKFVKKLKSLGMPNCGVHIATPYPGTELLKLCKSKGYLIYEDADNRLMFPGDFNIETTDFNRSDIIARTMRLKIAAGLYPDFMGGIAGFLDWKILPLLSRLGLHPRKFLADLPEGALENFYPPEVSFEGISCRWTAGDSAIEVELPRRARCLSFFADSFKDIPIKVFLDEMPLGELTISKGWAQYFLWLPANLPVGKARFQFQCDPFVPSEIGLANDNRKLGFLLSWHQFEKEKSFEIPFPDLFRKKFVSMTPEWLLDGFYAPQIETERIPYRWSGGCSSITVRVPLSAGSLTLVARSNRSHRIKIFLNDAAIGEIELQDGWMEYCLPLPADTPRGRARLRFESEVISLIERGSLGDMRELGFILSSFKFRLAGGSKIISKPFYPR